jgi:hypothetical protein
MVIIITMIIVIVGRDCTVGILTGCGLDYQGIGVRDPVVKNILFTAAPDRLWGQLSLLSNGYRGLFPRGG